MASIKNTHISDLNTIYPSDEAWNIISNDYYTNRITDSAWSGKKVTRYLILYRTRTRHQITRILQSLAWGIWSCHVGRHNPRLVYFNLDDMLQAIKAAHRMERDCADLPELNPGPYPNGMIPIGYLSHVQLCIMLRDASGDPAV